jgi:glyoxylase-like metal-dependent hydrolase (beta-lactamase superfamily II)
MPVAAPELIALGNGILLWQAYDPAVKADLFSTAVTTATGDIILVDPIQLARPELNRLNEQGRIAAIVVTNVNHHRATVWYSMKFSAALFGQHASFADEQIASATFVIDGDRIAGELEVIELEGAAPGEIALYAPANGGTLIIGDALINFPPHGFTLLPRKYCTNDKQLRRSLQKLLRCRAERILFAHGTPILSEATARLRELLGVEL